MSKRMRPSLKDYLKTGEVRLEVLETEDSAPQEEATPPKPKREAKKPLERAVAKEKSNAAPKTKKKKTSPLEPQPKVEPVVADAAPHPEESASFTAREFLDLLAEADRQMWEPILAAGVEIQLHPLDFPALREDFRTLDRNRFTCYTLERKGEPLSPVKTSVRIKEPLVLFLKWDEMGMLLLYGLSS